jgi:putative phage-type endonuclease
MMDTHMNCLLLLSECSSKREEWLKLRKIGSSDASAISGLNPWRTPYHAWLDLCGMLPPEDENDAMYWGKRLEALIADEFAERTRYTVLPCDKLFQHPVHEVMTASPDRFMLETVPPAFSDGDMEEKRGVLECKSAGAFTDHDWEAGPSDHALIQVQHQLAVCGLDYGYIAVLVGGREFYFHRVQRDEEIISKLIEMERDFWKLVEERTPPALHGSDGKLLGRVYPVASADTLLLPEEADKAAERILANKAIEKAAAANIERDQVVLKGLLRDSGAGLTSRYQVLWPSFPVARWDTKRLEADHPELMDEYKQARPERRFTVKPRKGC